MSTREREIMAKLDYSLRDLYRTFEEPGANPLRDAHTKLDTAVRAAYGMAKDADILTFLLALNHDLAAKEKSGQKITPPRPPPARRRTRTVYHGGLHQRVNPFYPHLCVL